MIRVGLTRWFVGLGFRPERDGRNFYSIILTPQARRYRVLTGEWRGLHETVVEKDVETRVFEHTVSESRWEATPKRLAVLLRGLAGEASSEMVGFCINNGLASDISKTAASYIVNNVLMKAVETGRSDDLDLVDSIDLVAEMRAIAVERQRQAEERRIQAEIEMAAHEAEAAERAILAREQAAGAVKTSFELLRSILTKQEVEELDKSNKVTVKILAGVFEVPCAAHGFVRQFTDDGEYVISHCIVFEDFKIPLGDEVAMKIALLKADPQRFLARANQHRERTVPRKNVR